MNNNDLNYYILSAQDALETVKFNVQMDTNDFVIAESVNDAIGKTNRAIDACTADCQNVRHDLLTTLEFLSELEKVYCTDPKTFYGLRSAIKLYQSAQYDDYLAEDAECLLDELNGSENIQDKLAIALLCIIIGEDYKGLATECLQEYLYSGARNIFISNDEILKLYKEQTQ